MVFHQGSRLKFYGKMCRKCYDDYSRDILRLQEERILRNSPPTQQEIELMRNRDALNLGLGRLLEETLQHFELKGIEPNEIATLLECCAKCDYTAPSMSKYVAQILPSDN